MSFLKDRLGKALWGSYSVVAALMFFFVLVIGKLTTEGNVEWSLGYFLVTAGISLILGIAAGGISAAAVCRLSDCITALPSVQKSVKGTILFKTGVVSCLLILFAWLPVFLAYYPGICSYDTYIQFGQLGSTAFNDHHPLFHTLLLGGFYNLGSSLFQNPNFGIALYVMVQSLLLAASMAYSLVIAFRNLYSKSISRKWMIIILGLMQLYFMFCPFHAFMAVTTTKDTVFSIFLLLQITALVALLTAPKGEGRQAVHYGIYCIGCIGSNLFRNNGKYAALILLIGLFVALCHGFITGRCRALFIKLFAATLGTLLLAVGMLSYVFDALGAVQGDRREMLSIPIQQLARTMVYHGGAGVLDQDDNTMDESDKQIINEFLLNESYKEYSQDIADPVKRHTNTYVVRYRAKDFISTYAGLLLDYPAEYVNAFLAVNAGFLDIADTSHAKVNLSPTEHGLGYIQTRWEEEEMLSHGIYKAPILPGLFEKLEHWTDTNGYLNIPILNYLLRPGIYLWLCIGAAVTLLVFQKYRYILPICYIAGYYATMLLGPTVQLRYVYPVMIIVPLILCICALKLDRVMEKQDGQ